MVSFRRLHGPARAPAASLPSAVVVAIAGLVAVVAVLVATRHGVGLTRDSISYLAAARNLVDGHGYVDFTGRPLTTFPPVFPVLTTGSTAVAALVNALAVAATVAVTATLARRHLRHDSVFVGALVPLALSPVLVDLARHVWSEPVFVALTMATLLALDRAEPVPAGLFAGLAFLTRYAGLVLVPVGVLVFLLGRSKRSKRDAAIYGGLAVVAPLAWLARNAAATDTTRDLMGPRLHATRSVAATLRRTAGGLKALVVPASTPAAVTALVALAALTAFVAIVGLVALRRTRRTGTQPLALLVFAPVYVVFIAASAQAAGADLDARTLGPVWPAALVLVAWVVDQAPSPRLVRPVAALAALATAAWAVSTVVDTDAVTGYPPRFDGLAAALAAVPPGATVVADDPWAVYERTRRQPVDFALVPVRPGLSILPLSTAELADLACDRPPLYAVVTDQSEDRTVRLPRSLGADEATAFTGGVVYRLRPIQPCAS